MTQELFPCRDIKPGNILIKVNQDAFDLETVSLCHLTFKLCDFGLSRYMPHGYDATMTMSTVGSYGYLAPEVRMDHLKKNVTSRYMASFDTFSAGVVAHELYTGKLELGAEIAVFVCRRCISC